MKLLLDNLNSTTGWIPSTNASVTLNTHPQYIAGNLTSSLVMAFTTTGDYIKKTYTTPVSTIGYKELVFSIMSLYKSSNDYQNPADFSYEISLGTGKDYYLPAYQQLNEVTIDISDLTSIEYIKVTALTADSDYIVLSYAVMCTDQMPLDIFVGLKEQLEYELLNDGMYNYYTAGTVSGAKGNNYITFTGITEPTFINRNTVIKITDGTNTEYHHISDQKGLTFYFSGLYDGKSLLNDYTNAVVYIQFPVSYGVRQKEIQLPGITIWTLESEKMLLANELDNVLDTWKIAGTTGERREGNFVQFPVLIDCESHHDELLAYASTIVRKVQMKRSIYVNGKRITLDFTEHSREIEPTDNFELIPKVQYTCNIQIKEDLYTRTYLPKTTTNNITVEVES